MRLSPSCFGNVNVQKLPSPPKKRKPRKKRAPKVKHDVKKRAPKVRKRNPKQIKSKNDQSGQAE